MTFQLLSFISSPSTIYILYIGTLLYNMILRSTIFLNDTQSLSLILLYCSETEHIDITLLRNQAKRN